MIEYMTKAEFENAKVFQKQKENSFFYLNKIIAYMLSFVCISFCITFILIKGRLILLN
jgi:large-conductance mechanosensitive channel